MSVKNPEEKLFVRFALDEFNDYAIYKELSKIEKKIRAQTCIRKTLRDGV